MKFKTVIIQHKCKSNYWGELWDKTTYVKDIITKNIISRKSKVFKNANIPDISYREHNEI